METTTPTQETTKKKPTGFARNKKQEEHAAKVASAIAKNTKAPPTITQPVHLLGMYRDSEGWKNIHITLSPDMTEVLDIKTSDGPSPRNITFDQFKIEAYKTFMKE